jgi:predicted ester cyclase
MRDFILENEKSVRMVLKFPELDTISVGSIKNDIRQPSHIRKGKRMKSKLRTDVITPAVAGGVREAIRRRLDPEEYRDIPGLMATLTEDCVYTVVNSGVSWNGKAGATQFYQHLLGAFPDIHFDLQNIVIGPQGVFEEAFVTGTYESQWLDMPSPDGQRIQFWVTILFPWDPGQKLFSGERIYFFLK